MVRRMSGGGSISLSRMAATGEMRPALIAGETAAPSVTRIPMPRLHATVVGRTTRGEGGMSTPVARRIERISEASPIPPNSPATEPTTLITAASPITIRKICERDPPMARMSASSCARWLIDMAKVFAMMNAPTTSDSTAKIRRNAVMNRRLLAT